MVSYNLLIAQTGWYFSVFNLLDLSAVLALWTLIEAFSSLSFYDNYTLLASLLPPLLLLLILLCIFLYPSF